MTDSWLTGSDWWENYLYTSISILLTVLPPPVNRTSDNYDIWYTSAISYYLEMYFIEKFTFSNCKVDKKAK